ncbi:MAG: hypothetical protein ACRDK2_16460 [Solirubrobacteraceae bacterium]
MSQPPAQIQSACPLCGALLGEQQDWCLRCGGAARTRLSAPASWRAPLVILTIVIVLSLGVLGWALVDLAGPSTGPSVTTTQSAPALTPSSPGLTTTTSTPAATAPAVTNTSIPTTATSGASGFPATSTTTPASPTSIP